MNYVEPMAEERIVPEVETSRASETEIEQGEHHNPVLCLRCGSDRIRRIARAGLLHQYIFPMFGKYPWRCGRCGALSMLKKRALSGKRHRHSHRAEEAAQSTPPAATPIER